MKIVDGVHWDINEILRYQRNFNFINGNRSLGKTYTTLFYVINYCIINDAQFIYIVRTQDEKKQGVFKQAIEKVLLEKFSDKKFVSDTENLQLINKNNKKLIGYCFALSEAVKIKKRSFPKVKFIVFDEYMLEKFQSKSYVNGWHEPDLFLSIYHTVDRENDKVICFLLGNTLNFFNPYHMHYAFNIPQVEYGKIWTSENVLFQWAKPKEIFIEKRKNCKFLNMIKNTNYGSQAINGEYVDNNTNFIKKLSGKAYYFLTLKLNNEYFGVFVEKETANYVISEKYDINYPFCYALTLEDHSTNSVIGFKVPKIKKLLENYRLGNVFFTSMFVKTKLEKRLISLL